MRLKIITANTQDNNKILIRIIKKKNDSFLRSIPTKNQIILYKCNFIIFHYDINQFSLYSGVKF